MKITLEIMKKLGFDKLPLISRKGDNFCAISAGEKIRWGRYEEIDT